MVWFGRRGIPSVLVPGLAAQGMRVLPFRVLPNQTDGLVHKDFLIAVLRQLQLPGAHELDGAPQVHNVGDSLLSQALQRALSSESRSATTMLRLPGRTW